ncbi:MAG: hypothetical protein IPL59_18445 [Candidatus Competibacteraceae bacterium]|nr:hypothetical protein [Candidatus Competibacteraceae bacterium]MBK8752333.1 hypothetical protein [Candidatus Competibacteraceae bacterium]
MPSARLLEKIDPDRYPNMTMTFAAMLGYVCGEEWTKPVILEIRIIDDVMIAMSEGQMLPNFLGEVPDLRAQLHRLGMVAGLTPEEWSEYQDLLESRLHLSLWPLGKPPHSF